MPFPSPPWQLRARAWVSLFAVRGVPGRPAGLYAAAFVDYVEGGVLSYHELLVARLVRGGAVTITDIWVDSPASLAGGRSLWAIPKDLADLPVTTSGRETVVEATTGEHPIARARFTPWPGLPLRLPFATTTRQQRSDGTAVVTPFAGSARCAAARAQWSFEPGGPLGFLHGRRAVASMHLSGARLRFG